MPFDQQNFELPLTDPAVRILDALIAFHSDPANWCDTGMQSGNARCIIAAANHVAREVGITFDYWTTGYTVIVDALAHALAPYNCGPVTFNEHRGTTHAELMAMYRTARDWAARRAEAGHG
jgi:hypothetical protein